ncbi:MlaE family ABC transporter permease [Pandoraea cepalis]|uniref:ABC transporter permease n=1 Tax=Pandoraea cepalis TaxID=2508294 RepID=A0A5E4S4J7_9BURK|nr:ABC transporter permease [Pandoraea cepalis]
MNLDAVPTLELTTTAQGPVVMLHGLWTALALSQRKKTLLRLVDSLPQSDLAWDLTRVERLDHVGAQALWRYWQRRFPERVALTPTQRALFDHLAEFDRSRQSPAPTRRLDPISRLGASLFTLGEHLRDGVTMFGRFVIDLGRVIRHPVRAPWLEMSANIYSAGAKALGITALVAFLIGIVLSYLSAQQLKLYGASTFIVNILGLAVIRELGPVLSAILVAGRSGSAITAQLGVMRVTEELDAMRVMDIPHGLRLVLPKVIALAIAMPLLVMWTNIIALLGGALAAKYELGIGLRYFFTTLPNAVPIANLWIGLGKGGVFGMLIALVACHFGMRVKPNTQSLGEGTTQSVVTSITVVILADAIFAILFRNTGIG